MATEPCGGLPAINTDSREASRLIRIPKLGSTPASGVAGRASRPAFFARAGRERLELLGAPDVFRAGAENGTRVRSPSQLHRSGLGTVYKIVIVPRNDEVRQFRDHVH